MSVGRCRLAKGWLIERSEPETRSGSEPPRAPGALRLLLEAARLSANESSSELRFLMKCCRFRRTMIWDRVMNPIKRLREIETKQMRRVCAHCPVRSSRSQPYARVAVFSVFPPVVSSLQVFFSPKDLDLIILNGQVIPILSRVISTHSQ